MNCEVHLSWLKHREAEMLLRVLHELVEKVNGLSEIVQSLKGEVHMISPDVQNLLDQVKRETDVATSLSVLMKGIAAKMLNNADDAAAIRAMAKDLTNSTAEMSDAVVAGTQAEGGTGGTTGGTGGTGATGTGTTGGTTDTGAGGTAPSGTDASGPTV
jgi:hypothetical protein